MKNYPTHAAAYCDFTQGDDIGWLPAIRRVRAAVAADQISIGSGTKEYTIHFLNTQLTHLSQHATPFVILQQRARHTNALRELVRAEQARRQALGDLVSTFYGATDAQRQSLADYAALLSEAHDWRDIGQDDVNEMIQIFD